MKIAVTFFSFKRIKPKKVLFKDIKEGPIWFCHFQEKKSLTSDLWLKEGIWHSLCRRKIYKLLDQFDVLAEPKTRFYNSEMSLRNIFWFFLFLFFLGWGGAKRLLQFHIFLPNTELLLLEVTGIDDYVATRGENSHLFCLMWFNTV